MMGVLLKLACVVFVMSMLASVVDAAPRKLGRKQNPVLTPRQTKTLEKMFMMYGRSFDFERKHGINGRNYLCAIAKSCDSRRKRDDTTSKKNK